MTFLFLSEADCVNLFSFGGKLTRLALLLTLLSLITSCLCSKFHRLYNNSALQESEFVESQSVSQSVLPFGLSSAPYLFTKLLKLLVKKWRTEGKSIVVFLDDGLGAAADYTKVRISSFSVHTDLLKSGFVPNEQKSLWEPTQVITWLGTVIGTSQCIISETDTRIQFLTEDLSFLLDSTHPTLYQVRKLASVCGKIISLGNCVGNVARLMTRNIFAVINRLL